MPSTEPERRKLCTADETEAALDVLRAGSERIAAAAWPGNLQGLDQPGLYSWWVDTSGAADLSSGLEMPLPAGRVYAGLTGATKWPSGRTGKRTLQERIGRNHLRGRIEGSTFRRTLAACLRAPMGLRLVAPGQLDCHSECKLNSWMSQHLEVAVYPFADRDVLKSLEEEVIAALDPPLNLDGMPATPLRARLSELRSQLRPDLDWLERTPKT